MSPRCGSDGCASKRSGLFCGWFGQGDRLQRPRRMSLLSTSGPHRMQDLSRRRSSLAGFDPWRSRPRTPLPGVAAIPRLPGATTPGWREPVQTGSPSPCGSRLRATVPAEAVLRLCGPGLAGLWPASVGRGDRIRQQRWITAIPLPDSRSACGDHPVEPGRPIDSRHGSRRRLYCRLQRRRGHAVLPGRFLPADPAAGRASEPFRSLTTYTNSA